MSVFSGELSRALTGLETLMGTPVCTLSGADFRCTPSTLRKGTEIVVGGMAVTITLTLIVRVDTGMAPTTGKQIVYSGTTYRIVNVGKAPGGSHYEIDVADLNR